MPILDSTDIEGRIEAILVNRDRAEDLTSSTVERVQASYAGFEGENHGGLTRRSCVRVKRQYPPGTEIRNVRQVTILSLEELTAIGAAMNLPTPPDPSWLGGNLVLSGIPDLTLLPPSSRLILESGASLVVDMENGPCRHPGDIIERHFPGHGRLFAKAALGRRGVTAWVEREGEVALGETLHLHVPPQRIYHHAMARHEGRRSQG